MENLKIKHPESHVEVVRTTGVFASQVIISEKHKYFVHIATSLV